MEKRLLTDVAPFETGHFSPFVDVYPLLHPPASFPAIPLRRYFPGCPSEALRRRLYLGARLAMLHHNAIWPLALSTVHHEFASHAPPS